MRTSRLLLLCMALGFSVLATRATAQLGMCPTTYACSQVQGDCAAQGGTKVTATVAGHCVATTTGMSCTLYNFTCTPTNPLFSGQCITCP
jgi:hypothetical protein